MKPAVDQRPVTPTAASGGSFLLRSIESVDVRRISPGDSNYFALLFGPENDATDPVGVVEIFEVGGKTPPNRHARAHEFFYVLSGNALVHCDGASRKIGRGDALMVRPGSEHVIENTGSSKLYTLTFMVPNEGFAELIRAGERVALDDEDRATLLGYAE